MEPCRWLPGLILVVIVTQGVDSADDKEGRIEMEEIEDQLQVSCKNEELYLLTHPAADWENLKNRTVMTPKITDFSFMVKCSDKLLQVHSRMCQNCIEVDPVTLIGIIMGDILATGLLALGVFCMARHEGRPLSSASDQRSLMANDQLYQPLRDRDDGQYSHIGGNRPRKK
ncbi:T-cell surface glycoprotein CD3 delta chain-like isoform X1 [Ornithorhynchus anatinus]|uniref:T-cell surface glycoprotein CD3 delta chain n=2 Tax=Ornithorhynchus anatinus TaxID=9258 RepID=F6X8T6_ORNAN|nr:T-cell surface glycoprotein CD3 delta chain-like isoform X1 [Ornithorhynchus anatinus]